MEEEESDDDGLADSYAANESQNKDSHKAERTIPERGPSIATGRRANDDLLFCMPVKIDDDLIPKKGPLGEGVKDKPSLLSRSCSMDDIRQIFEDPAILSVFQTKEE